MFGPSNDRIPASEFRLAELIARKSYAVYLRNFRFNSLTPERQRHKVAKDVLKWLALGKLSAGPGYLASADLHTLEVAQRNYGGELTTNGYECEVCAIGAAVCVASYNAGIKLYREGRLVGDYSGVSIHDALKGIFEPKQLALMEAAFEGPHRAPSETIQPYFDDYVQGNAFTSHKDLAAAFVWFNCHTWGDLMRSRQQRLVALWENIRDNKGTFVP